MRTINLGLPTAIQLLILDCGQVWGGGQSQAFLLARECALLGIHVTVGCPKTSELFHRLQVEGVKVLPINGLLSIPILAFYCLINQVNVVNAHCARALRLAYYLKRLIPSLKLWLHRGTHVVPRKNAKYKAVNGFVAVSQSIVEILKGCDFQNVFLCPPAVDVERFLRAGLDRVYSDVVRIGAVGRLVAEKNHRCFIEALNILKSSGYQFEAAIIGEGIEHDSLVRLKGQYQLKSLQITGFCDNVPAAMSQLDIVVLPSTAEAFGLVNVEAAACGCWVVAANLPGVRDFVQHGVTGFLFDPCSPEELARVLADLMEKRVPDTRASAKQKAQTYSPKYFAANVLRLFGSL